MTKEEMLKYELDLMIAFYCETIQTSLHRARELHAAWKEGRGEFYKDLYLQRCKDLTLSLRRSIKPSHPILTKTIGEWLWTYIKAEAQKPVEHTEEQVESNDWGDAFDDFFSELVGIEGQYGEQEYGEGS